MNVWSPRPVPVQFQAGIATVDVNHGGTGWEVLTFGLGNAAGNVDSIAIIFDNGTNGNAAVDPANWTFYFDDITLVPPGGGAGVSIIPEVTLYYPNPAGDPSDLVIPDDYDEITVFGSESVYNLFYADDDTYGEVLAVSSGTGYNANVAQVGFIGFDPGFVTFYESLEFKVKGIPNLVIFVSLYEGGERVRINLSSSGFASGLGNGWYQVSIPISRFTGLTTATGIVFESDDTAAMQFTFFLNDIGFSGGGDGGGDTGGGDTVLATFDEATPPAITEFGGAIATIAAGPAGGDGNALKIDRNNGGTQGLVFAGAWVAIPPIPSDAGDQTVSVRVYSPTAGIRMVAKAEYGDQLGSGDTEANEAVVVGWQTLTWTFTNFDPNESYNRFVLLPNLGNVDDLDYYFDDITVVGAGGGDTGGGDTVLTTFDEATPPAITEFGGAIATIAAGPAGGDGNALKIDRNNGGTQGLVFAGAWVAIPPIPSDAGDQTVSVRVYSPTAGIRMVAKAEYGDQLGSGDTEANEAVVVGWQTLTWTFTNLDPNESYNRFVLLPNLGNVDDLDYYFDDITVVGTGGGGGGPVEGNLAVNGAFDTGDFSGWAQYPSAQTTQTIVVDATTSSNVARLFIPASAGGVNNVLKQERLLDGEGVFSAGDVIEISFDYRGEAGEGILFVKSICETAEPICGDKLHNNGGPFLPTATWTNYSDTFTLGAGVTGYTLEFAAVCGGTGTCVADYFIDNVSIVIN
jgi:hypothetical protein